MNGLCALKFLYALCVALVLSASGTWAQYPEKAIRFVVPFAPGGTSEIVARSVASSLTTQLGQSVYVENKPGAAGSIAMAEVKRAAPDGYTLILGHVGTLAVNPALFGAKLTYDPVKDFVAISLIAKVPNVIAVSQRAGFKTLADMVAFSSAAPHCCPPLSRPFKPKTVSCRLLFRLKAADTDTDVE